GMAWSRVGRVGAGMAGRVVEESFAQFQADRAVVGTAKRVASNIEALQGYADAVSGDFDELLDYVELRERISKREKALAKHDSAARRGHVLESLDALRRGDVIAIPSGRRAGLAVVVDPGHDPVREPHPTVVNEDRWCGSLTAADFSAPVEALGTVRLPKQVELGDAKTRRDIANKLR